MTAWGWPELVALTTSVAYGVGSAVVPVLNAEAYVVASQVASVAGALPVAVGVAVGQTIGKLLLFLGVRRGREFRVTRHRAAPTDPRPKSPARQGFDRFVRSLLDLVGRKRWGLPVTFLAAVVGLPPLYAVALLAGATRMRAVWFAAVVLAGRVLRFVAVALGVHALV